MTFKAEFTFDSLSELQAFIAGKADIKPEAEAPKPVTRQPRGPKPEATGPVPTAQVEKVPGNTSKIPFKAKEESVQPAAPVLTYDDVKNATLKVVEKAGKPAAVALLAKFGAQKADQIGEENWPGYLEEANALVAKGKSEELA